jgi:hypothetical protein
VAEILHFVSVAQKFLQLRRVAVLIPVLYTGTIRDAVTHTSDFCFVKGGKREKQEDSCSYIKKNGSHDNQIR